MVELLVTLVCLAAGSPSQNSNELSEAQRIVEAGNFKFVDHNDPTRNETRVLLFTYCNHGEGASAKHGDVGLLCNTWWEAHGSAWAKANRIAVAMIDESVSTDRTQHWCKVAYSHAWMRSTAPLHRFDEIVFSDADAVVRRANWDVREFFYQELRGDTHVLMADDDWDYAITAFMFMKNTKEAHRLMEAWYVESHRFYGVLSTGRELPAVEERAKGFVGALTSYLRPKQELSLSAVKIL